MKLLIDESRVEAIKDYFRHPEGFVNADVADLLTDRDTLLAEIKELKEVIRDRDAEIKDFYRIQP